jgi:hypothetical protein
MPLGRRWAASGTVEGHMVPLPHQVVWHLVPGIRVGVVRGGRLWIHAQRDRRREHPFGLVQGRRVDQQVAAVELHHAQLPGIERAQLRGGDVDALDLAAVFEMPGDVRVRVVAGTPLQQRRQPGARLAPLPGLFLARAFGLEPFLLLALGAQRIGLAEIDLGKAYALRAQREKQERLEAERARQEQARQRREARARLAALLQGRARNDPDADIARHFEYGGKIKRIHVTAAQLRALNAGELGVVQLDGRYLLVDAATLDEAERVFAPAVALRVDPQAPAADDPYADPRYQVPDDLVW